MMVLFRYCQQIAPGACFVHRRRIRNLPGEDAMVRVDGIASKLEQRLDIQKVPLNGGEPQDEWNRAPARIKVVGVGGGGCNTVRRMMAHSVRGVKYAMLNTDVKPLEQAQALSGVNVDVVQIGKRATRGWGAGGHAKVGEQAAEESAEEVRRVLKDAELVFITAGMGGGTGTGATPYVAHLAKEMGALVVGVVTTPFSFEGSRRRGDAISGVRRLRPYVDNLIVIHNDRLLRYMHHDAEMLEAFRTADEVVTQGILSVSELINVPGEINVDFADVRSIMGSPGGALMAIGEGAGKMGPVEAAKQAIRNPLLNLSIQDAKGVLFSVRGGHEVTLGGCNAAGQLIRKVASKNAKIFFGMTVDYAMEGKVQLTLIATGLKEESWVGALSDLGSIGGGLKKLLPTFGLGKKKSGYTPLAAPRV
ncbi:MAG: cell division protein FtsZ [SAR202 cluster bacterium]|nr:cell division protein FtsZ [SAR202 cluster bacterium]